MTDRLPAGDLDHGVQRGSRSSGWKKLGLKQSLGTRLVTYADDLVILCRRGNAEKALRHLREIIGKLKLTVNEEKTKGAATDMFDLQPPRHISTLRISPVAAHSGWVGEV